jgi:hypothetical protein
MRCLDVCVAVLFMVDLSSYDRSVEQDGGTAINSIRLSLTLFEQMLVAPWFSHADITLLLNKRDSFEDKIRRGIPLGVAFPEWKETNPLTTYEESLKKVIDTFIARAAATNPSRIIYTHVIATANQEQTISVMDNVFQKITDAHSRMSTPPPTA